MNKCHCPRCRGEDRTVAENLIDWYDALTSRTPAGVHVVQGLQQFNIDPSRFANLAIKLNLRGSLFVFRSIAEGWDLQRIIQELN